MSLGRERPMSLSTTTAPNALDPSRADASQATRRRVLVVDDDAAVLGLLEELLEPLDVDVVACLDPEQALCRFQESHFDLVISDLKMPKMQGTEVLRVVRSRSPRTPTILITGYGDARTEDVAYERCGVFRMLAKPWDNVDLAGTVREALRARALLD
jgi:DNA-binding NtrC family response regulator